MVLARRRAMSLRRSAPEQCTRQRPAAGAWCPRRRDRRLFWSLSPDEQSCGIARSISPVSYDGPNLGCRPILADRVDFEWAGLLAGHARRARRHTGQRDAGDGRTFGEQTTNHFHRHMPVDHVVVDEHRMAAFQLGRHASFAADLGKIVGWLDVDLEAVLAQIGGVTFTAIALWVLLQAGPGRCSPPPHPPTPRPAA